MFAFAQCLYFAQKRKEVPEAFGTIPSFFPFFSPISSPSTGLPKKVTADGSRLRYEGGSGDFHWKQRTSWLCFATFYKSQNGCAAGLRDPSRALRGTPLPGDTLPRRSGRRPHGAHDVMFYCQNTNLTAPTLFPEPSIATYWPLLQGSTQPLPHFFI